MTNIASLADHCVRVLQTQDWAHCKRGCTLMLTLTYNSLPITHEHHIHVKKSYGIQAPSGMIIKNIQNTYAFQSCDSPEFITIESGGLLTASPSLEIQGNAL